jgi:hypothetical protein
MFEISGLHRNIYAIDRYNAPVNFFPDVPQILNQIRAFENCKIAACSRTSATAL